MNDSSSKYLLSLVGLSFGLLILLSAIPWSDITNNTIKDFNLFEDVLPSRPVMAASDPLPLDLELAGLETESASNSGGADGTNPLPAGSDSIEPDTVPEILPVYEEAPLYDGKVIIESYAGGQGVLPHFRQALSEAGKRTVRVAVLGDSYIEGDIFVQDVRRLLQERHGGSGVGFSPMHSEFPGFRRSMNLSSQGWTLHDIRTQGKRDSLRTLSGDYAVADINAISTFKGSKRTPHADSWERTTFIFVAPAAGSVKLSGDNGIVIEKTIEASPEPQSLVLEGSTASATVQTNVPGLIGLGVYADAMTGVQVDCMSVRGNSGMSLNRLNNVLCTDMRQWVDYDLIVLEFGMNVISQGRLDYTAYGQYMQPVVESLKKLYPNADILIMGVGDRASKASGTLASMPECTGMVNAQRNLARQTGTYFWDTRAAMGGDGAAMEWRKKKYLNADYIHLNHDGGGELAELFDFALNHAVSND